MKKLIPGSLALLLLGFRPLPGAEVRTLPPAVYEQMKSGSKLGKLWINPAFDVAQGFTIGQVANLADGIYAKNMDYFPYALSRLAIPESPNVLSLTVIELNTVERAIQGYFSASVGVEGQVLAPDGKVLMAFRTREEVGNRETLVANIQGAIDKIVWSISRDLGKPFQRALEARQDPAARSTAVAAPLPSRPPKPETEPSPDIKGRLMRLEDLKQRGLITQEEYQAHREAILKGL